MTTPLPAEPVKSACLWQLARTRLPEHVDDLRRRVVSVSATVKQEIGSPCSEPFAAAVTRAFFVNWTPSLNPSYSSSAQPALHAKAFIVTPQYLSPLPQLAYWAQQ